MRDRALGSTVRLRFTTTDSNGAPVAPSSAFVAADFRIYKDGSATEKTTTNGITVTSPFDSVTGRHLIEIDTSNSTGDSGFWASGSAYFVELNTAKTVNSQSVSGLEIGSFSLELQTADVRKFGGNAGTFASGRPEVRVASMADNTLTASSLATDAVDEIADGVWDEATSGHTTAGTYGGRIVRATNSNVEVLITGSNHIAADVHEFQNGVIEATDFAAGAITSTVIAADAITSSQLAASAVTEIQSGLATTANQTVMIDGIGFMTSVLMGSISDAGTAGETTVISFAGSTYTVDYSGLDAIGNRSTTTRTKT
jgi:hypothetical protein